VSAHVFRIRLGLQRSDGDRADRVAVALMRALRDVVPAAVVTNDHRRGLEFASSYTSDNLAGAVTRALADTNEAPLRLGVSPDDCRFFLISATLES
jgi:hypothetical protein